MAQTKARTATKVRPDSRVGLAVKALLDSGDLHLVPGCYPKYLGRGAALLSPEGVMRWAKDQGMEMRAHDLEEMRHCLRPLWSQTLDRARGLWAAATGYAHDFEDDGRVDWAGSYSPDEVVQYLGYARTDAEKARGAVARRKKEADDFDAAADRYEATEQSANAKQFRKYASEQRDAMPKAVEALTQAEAEVHLLEEELRKASEAQAKKPVLT